jgi:hypothetical protein
METAVAVGLVVVVVTLVTSAVGYWLNKYNRQ